ncbi:MAG: hypothetical protein JKY54_15685 [Flavobacteriales bacterium]|nr:hypothetical protein [Flavobacteriales bacterium]
MNKQKGITLIGAIFVLVIVSLLGQYLVNITGVQRQTSLLALQSARAYQAANAGIEWGIERIINSASCVASTTLTPNIANFTTTVSCNTVGTYNEDGTVFTIFRITSESEYGSYGQIDYVSREIETIIHD